MTKKTLLSWSSGKDSAWALYTLQHNPEIELVGLFTTINKKYSRAAMHSTRLELLYAQADAAGLPLEIIELPNPCSGEDYQAIMRTFINKCILNKIECIAFGDLFLEDIRKYRVEQLKDTRIEPIFPVWLNIDKLKKTKSSATVKLAEQMLSAGIETYISCINLKKLPKRFVGRKWTKELISELSEGCDCCGENGEFHTVATGGPMFRKTIPIRIGEIVERDGYAFADIIPESCQS